MVFLFVGVLGAIVTIMQAADRRRCRLLGWFGLVGRRRLVDLDLHAARHRGATATATGSISGLLTLSPSSPPEFAKLAMIVWGAHMLARKHRLLDQPKHLLVPFCR